MTTKNPKGRILVMDDEEIVRTLLGRMIEALGCECALSSDGNEAVMLFRQALDGARPFDAAILDLTVKGGLGGEYAASEIRKMSPDAKIIITSGYSDDEKKAEVRKLGIERFLVKPFEFRDVADILKGVI